MSLASGTGAASDAGGGGGGVPDVNQFFGSAQSTIAIRTPGFHGIEPHLALAYNSSGGNGFVGVGWSLTGFGFIERVSPGRGAPTYTSADRFLLDGNELIACQAASTSPSCTTCPSGATCYSTKIESYQRIQFDAAAGKFYVWSKHGDRTTYRPVHGVSCTASGCPDTFRYGIGAMTDPHGNTVGYNWWCDPGNDCFPDSITYNQTVIKLYAEQRPDPYGFATGSSPGRKNYRLKTIDITTAGSRVRSYQLSYTASASTSRSLLAGVQQLGSDAQLDASGTVTGGTALSILSTTAASWTTGGDGTFAFTNVGDPSGWIWNSDAQTVVGDFNGDGKADVAARFPGWATTPILFSNGNGSFRYTNTGDPSGGTWNAAGAEVIVGDFDGDGKADLALRNAGWGSTPIFFSNGDGTFRYTNVTDPSGWVWNAAGAQILIGDFNGDGKTDVALRHDGWGTTPVFLSNGNGTFSYSNAGDPSGGVWNEHGAQTLIGDFNGDGKTDVALRYNGWGSTPTFFSNGDGTFRYTNVGDPSGGTWNAAGAQAIVGDFNGDGKTDIALRNKTWGSTPIFFSNGNGSFSYSNAGDPSGGTWNASGAEFYTGDFNGDGITDVALRNIGWGSTPIFFSRGDGTFRYANNTDPSGGVWNASGDHNSLFQCNNGFVTLAQVCSSGCSVQAAGVQDHCNDGGGRCPSGNGLYCGNDGMGGDANTLYECYNGIAVAAKLCVNGCQIKPAGQNDTCNPDPMIGGCPSGNGLYCGGDAVSGAQILIGDFDGDGKTDVALRDVRVGWTTTPIFFSGGGNVPDLVTSLRDVAGGTTTLAYAPSSGWTNTNNPPLVHTVTSIVTGDGRGGSSTTTYSYAGGLFDPIERRFLGFHYVKRTLDAPNDGCTGGCTRPFEETWFAQDYGSVSKPTEVRFTDDHGTLLTDHQMTYATNGAAQPFQSLLTEEWTLAYATGSSACSAWPCATGKRTRVLHVYDVYDVTRQTPTWTTGYGNETSTLMLGDADATGDDTTTITTFYPNTTDYLVDYPARIQVFDGDSTTPLLVSEQDRCYDLAVTASSTCNSAAWVAPPVHGDVTHTATWLDLPSSSYVVTKTAYDSYGNVTRQIDALGNTTTIDYDTTFHRFAVKHTNALNQVSSATWNAVAEAPATETDLNNGVTSYSYDVLGRQTSVTAPLGASTTTLWCAPSSTTNQCGSTTGANAQYVETDTPSADASGVQWSRRYLDGNGRTWRTVAKGPGAAAGQPYSAPQNIVADTAFDAHGDIAVAQAAGYGAARSPGVSHTHDALGRPLAIVYPTAGGTTGPAEHFDYATAAWTTTHTDELGHQTRATRDAHGHVVEHSELHDGTWAATDYRYDLRGNLVQVTDPASHVTSYTVDSLGRRIAMTDADLGSWSWTYDAAGHITQQTDGNGRAVTWHYDALDRPLSKTSADGTATWTYDEARAGYANLGQRTTMTDSAGSATYDHDALGRVTHRTRSVGGTQFAFALSYDAGGRLLGTRYPDGDVVGVDPITGTGSALGYDSAGRLASVPGVVSATQYDALGNLTSQSNANGTVTTRTYAADARPWLATINTHASSHVYQDLSFGRDDAGKITSLVASTTSSPNQSAVGWTFAYDDLNRLTSATNTSNAQLNATYHYDVLGNITSSPAGNYSYGTRPHAVTAVGTTSYTYDAAGNMTSRGGTAIIYDGNNQVSQIGATAFIYDGDGERLQATTAGQTTTYLGDDYEIAPSGVVIKYLAGGARRVASTTYWIHTDHLGSTQVETDAAGTPGEAERIKYAPYGSRISTALVAGVPDDARGFTGQRQDPTGLIYLHARYYDPVIGRFISPDTIVPSDRLICLDRYAYADDNPVMNTDPSGHRNVYVDGDGSPAPVYEGAVTAAGEARYQTAVAQHRIAPRPYRPVPRYFGLPLVPTRRPTPQDRLAELDAAAAKMLTLIANDTGMVASAIANSPQAYARLQNAVDHAVFPSKTAGELEAPLFIFGGALVPVPILGETITRAGVAHASKKALAHGLVWGGAGVAGGAIAGTPGFFGGPIVGVATVAAGAAGGFVTGFLGGYYDKVLTDMNTPYY
ncbi:MAG TPA: FG-GAP-like repeat-containing protein [Kofleriaceae bacterium]